jgi:hypothetical protein
MAEQWIPAKLALEIVKDERSLLDRLRTDLLTTRARMIKSKFETLECKPVGPAFWEIDPYSNFKADWDRGDFTNCIDGELDVDVYGLDIELSGILDMVPFEQRGMVLRSISVAGNPDWISARDAYARCFDSRSPNNAGRWLIDQASLGFLVARAVQAERLPRVSGTKPTWIEREWDVPAWFWDHCRGRDTTSSWPEGRFSVQGVDAFGRGGMVLRGVHFHRPTLDAALTSEEKPVAEPAEIIEHENNRGRRPSYDWHTACSSIWGMLLRSELIPEVQADVEKALIAFLAKGDKEPSVSTVRPYAKIIFQEYSKA